MKSVHRPLGLFALTLGLFVLSFAVFNWGLQYKMSLYQNTSGVTQAPAKLWTGKTTESSDSGLTIQTQTPPALFFIALLLLLRGVCCNKLETYHYSHVSTSWKQYLRPFLRTFFFRPPPIFV